VNTLLDGYHLALHLQAAALESLQNGLAHLEGEGPTMLSLSASPDKADALALLGFATAGAATAQLPAIRRLSQDLKALLVDLGSCDGAVRAKLKAMASDHELRTLARSPIGDAFSSLRRLMAAIPLTLEFPDLEALYHAWARSVAEGGFWVPGASAGPTASYRVTFAVGADRMPGSLGAVLDDHAPGREGRGFWLEVAPSEALRGLLTRRARERRQGRPTQGPPSGVVRREPRFETMLEVRLDDLPSMAEQWAADISHGGMFICCPAPPELRAQVQVHLSLPDGGEFSIPAEVVHRILFGPRPGVGVQFLDRDPQVLAPLEALLAEYQRRRPRVLVVDDEAIWRSTLARALAALGVDVQLACDGHEGLLKLIDGYFDLDLVILDLHMPHLDGRGLIQRVRSSGGDTGLKMFLFSAASPEELASLAEPGLATGVFSKMDSIDALTARIARELGLPIPGMPKPKAA
jgi:two-component system, chemotaxis family, chemotaxis protein CheY